MSSCIFNVLSNGHSRRRHLYAEIMIQHGDVVTLLSNAQPQLFPDNTAYRFTNRLPHHWRIPEGERWRVGVSEFATLNTLDTLPMDLTLDVSVNDDRFQKCQHERLYFFRTDAPKPDEALTVQEIEQRLVQIQIYTPPLSPTYDACDRPWNNFINGLRGVTQQMLNQSGYDLYFHMIKREADVQVGVKHGDQPLSDTLFILSPALQHLLLLDDPTGVQSLKSFDTLKQRFVLSKSGKHCDFWVRIIPNHQNAIESHWPGFDATVGTDPFMVLKALADKYDFFAYEEQADGKRTLAKLKFKETGSVVMVEFPANFLKIPKNDPTFQFKLAVSTPQYQITTKDKNPIVDTTPLGRHLNKDGVTTTRFFMTDGSEIQLSRHTSAKPSTGYALKNFNMHVYHAKHPMTLAPYHKTYRVPRGNYTQASFIATLKTLWANQHTFTFKFESQRAAKRARRSDDEEEEVTFKMTPASPGYIFTFDTRFQSILALDRPCVNGPITGSRTLLLSSFTYNLLLYCKWIKPCIQGGQFETVLRTIPFPTKKQHGENVMKEFRHIQFHELAGLMLQDLDITIRDDTGALVQLNDGRTMLKLVFERAK